MENPATTSADARDCGGPPQAARPQAELFAVLTMQVTTSEEAEVRTARARLTAGPHVTREDIFEHLRGQFPQQYHGSQATVLLFTAEPNQLTPAAG